MELDCHAVRISVGGPVGDVRYSRGIGESRCHWNRAAVEQCGTAQSGCLARCLEVAFRNDALGVVGAEPRMDTKYFVHRVDELLLNRLILSLDGPGPC